MGEKIDLSEWYEPREAARVLTRNSGREVKPSYVRKLAEYGKVKSLKINERASLYWRADIDPYIVEARGKKSGEAKRKQKEERERRTSL